MRTNIPPEKDSLEIRQYFIHYMSVYTVLRSFEAFEALFWEYLINREVRSVKCFLVFAVYTYFLWKISTSFNIGNIL